MNTRLINSKLPFTSPENTFAPLLLNITLPSPTKDKDLLRVSNEKAKEIGINPYDLYAGIDVQENGYNMNSRSTLS